MIGVVVIIGGTIASFGGVVAACAVGGGDGLIGGIGIVVGLLAA